MANEASCIQVSDVLCEIFIEIFPWNQVSKNVSAELFIFVSGLRSSSVVKLSSRLESEHVFRQILNIPAQVNGEKWGRKLSTFDIFWWKREEELLS